MLEAVLRFLTSLREAPVANLLVLGGLAFVFLAATRGCRHYDRVGRLLLLVIGLVCLGVGFRWVAILAPGPTKGSIVPSPADERTAVVRTIDGPEVYSDWGYEESKRIDAAVTLPSGARPVRARTEILEQDKAKSYRIVEPTYDATTNTPRGAVEFRGYGGSSST